MNAEWRRQYFGTESTIGALGDARDL